MERYTKKEMVRFTSAYKRSGECKLWKRYLDKDGYGSFFFRRVLRRAHRIAYYFFIGDIPKGMIVDHICRNRNCIEYTHLRLVTPKENSIQNSNSVGAINARKTHCKNGHPFDKKYGKQRYCSICQAQKTKHLRAKWKKQDTIMC